MTHPFDDVKSVLSFAKHTFVWISIFLLIKGHNDLRTSIVSLEQQLLMLPNETEKITSHYSIPTKPFFYQEPKTFGDFHISGSLTVDKCILWQQPMGVFQNSCTVFTQTHYDCVHGIMIDVNGSLSVCKCDENWWGNICDMHDCFGRGEFSVAMSACICYMPAYGKYCESLESNSQTPCNVENCNGICINNNCVCNKKGQLGKNCYQCASPAINATLCPGRTDWSKVYYSQQDFFVCNGGYTSNPDILIIRYKNCRNGNDCTNVFHESNTCCNSVAFNGTTCSLWQSFTYNINEYPNTIGTVFNSGYQLRHMAILNEHNPLSVACRSEDVNGNNCIARAANQIQESDWPLLHIDYFPNQAYYLKRGQLYLSLGQDDKSYSHTIPAEWGTKITPLYLRPSGVFNYENTKQFYYVMLFHFPDTFCLAKENMQVQTYATMFESLYVSNIHDQTAYWINLRDQPGQALNIKTFCGNFIIDYFNLNSNSYNLTKIVNNQPFYLGPGTKNFVWYYSKPQNTNFTIL